MSTARPDERRGLGEAGRLGRLPWSRRGETVGIAIFNHPSSFRYPTGWHVRTYGLFAANPFAQQGFAGKGKWGRVVRIAARQGDRVRTTVAYLHRGDQQQGKVAEAFAEYAKVREVETRLCSETRWKLGGTSLSLRMAWRYAENTPLAGHASHGARRDVPPTDLPHTGYRLIPTLSTKACWQGFLGRHRGGESGGVLLPGNAAVVAQEADGGHLAGRRG